MGQAPPTFFIITFTPRIKKLNQSEANNLSATTPTVYKLSATSLLKSQTQHLIMQPQTSYPASVVKSNFVMTCCACKCKIHRGDEITQVEEGTGIQLRPRRYKNGGGRIPYTGARWVHKNCTPTSKINGQDVPIWTAYSAETYADQLNNHTNDNDYY